MTEQKYSETAERILKHEMEARLENVGRLRDHLDAQKLEMDTTKKEISTALDELNAIIELTGQNPSKNIILSGKFYVNLLDYIDSARKSIQ